jgi:hypothetical protein
MPNPPTRAGITAPYGLQESVYARIIAALSSRYGSAIWRRLHRTIVHTVYPTNAGADYSTVDAANRTEGIRPPCRWWPLPVRGSMRPTRLQLKSRDVAEETPVCRVVTQPKSGNQ